VVNKVEEYLKFIPDDKLAWIRYDYSATDIGTIAMRRGMGKVEKADKSRESGISTIQSLLKNGKFKVCFSNDKSERFWLPDYLMETGKLIEEFETLGVDDKKQIAEDDSIDAVRYAINGVPFDWESIGAVKLILAPEEQKTDIDFRRERGYDQGLLDEDLVEAEIEYWNDMMED
jgi:hypothetical protein